MVNRPGCPTRAWELLRRSLSFPLLLLSRGSWSFQAGITKLELSNERKAGQRAERAESTVFLQKAGGQVGHDG
ncbi:MAG: hypothetical protein HC899_38440 [Leptolyngbyaceae cyanobacterium SM1_4_3]|nr:hypothetical protein [Leptolyngbyaceae cyanobacterium SM1_4_3]